MKNARIPFFPTDSRASSFLMVIRTNQDFIVSPRTFCTRFVGEDHGRRGNLNYVTQSRSWIEVRRYIYPSCTCTGQESIASRSIKGPIQDLTLVLKFSLSAHTTRRIHATAPATSSRLFVVSRFSPFKRFAPKAPPSLCSQTL